MARPRYSIASIMLVTLIGCAAASAAHYLVRSLMHGDRDSHFVFLLLTLAGPAVFVLLFSLVWSFLHGDR